jgi:ribosomal protein L11 methyltransferase
MKKCVPGTSVELTIKTNDPLERELCVARLDEFGFEGYAEEDDALQAYMPCESFEKVKDNVMEWLLSRKLEHGIQFLAERNWNEDWEKNFEPVTIEDKIHIRADFHPKPDNDKWYDIIITPKMSFGTGHHDTTSMMMKYMLGINLKDAEVLDLGSGTGILSIMASKLGAKKIVSLDNDPQACVNEQENITQNIVTNVEVKLGDIGSVQDQTFDCILANINRNVLVQESARIYAAMRTGGTLLLSGILKEDIDDVTKTYQAFNLILTGSLQTAQWAALCFKKI